MRKNKKLNKIMTLAGIIAISSLLCSQTASAEIYVLKMGKPIKYGEIEDSCGNYQNSYIILERYNPQNKTKYKENITYDKYVPPITKKKAIAKLNCAIANNTTVTLVVVYNFISYDDLSDIHVNPPPPQKPLTGIDKETYRKLKEAGVQ